MPAFHAGVTSSTLVGRFNPSSDCAGMLSVVKTEERLRARQLRARGWSVKEIERELNVSRASVSLWVRDVPLDERQRAILAQRTRMGPLIAAARKAARAREVRRGYQEHGRQLVRERDASYAAGCMLYWAEGSKSRNTAQVVNSDPELLAFFAGFLRTHFVVASDSMRLCCNLFADHLERQRQIEEFWLARLELPRSSLTKSIVNSYSKYSQKKRNGKLPYGTARLSVHSSRIVQTIYGSIQEYGGFERPAWLD
jgi:transcriptional regulator with XRE-family HTH domain